MNPCLTEQCAIFSLVSICLVDLWNFTSVQFSCSLVAFVVMAESVRMQSNEEAIVEYVDITVSTFVLLTT